MWDLGLDHSPTSRVMAGVQEEFEIVQAIVQGLGLGWRLGLETNHVRTYPFAKHEGHCDRK